LTKVGIIREQAEQILAEDPDGIVRFRLLRDVLHRSSDDKELVGARKALDQSPWVRKLKREQRSDGSWGLLHGRFVGTLLGQLAKRLAANFGLLDLTQAIIDLSEKEVGTGIFGVEFRSFHEFASSFRIAIQFE
jgi:hypothetical protein